MLTVKIKDKRLEKRITERALHVGKSTQDYVNELLAIVLPDIQDSPAFKQLPAEEHGYVLNFESEGDKTIEEATPFSHVVDSESYTTELRRKAWRKE